MKTVYFHDKSVSVGSLRDADDCRKAATIATEGRMLGLSAGAVCLLMFDGEYQKSAYEVMNIKGETRGLRPSTLLLSASRFVPMLDERKIAPVLHKIFLNAGEVESRLAALCLIRAPVLPEISLPSTVMSHTSDGTKRIQNWLPEDGNPLCTLLKAMQDAGIVFPAVTSLNLSQEPEIVDQDEGIRFCAEHGIPLFLTDPERGYLPRGSFPILGLDDKGVNLIREGHFSGDLFEKLLGMPIDMTGSLPSKYALLDIPSVIRESTISPSALRRYILSWLEGDADALV
jgi:hypothetical protein